MNSDDFSGRAKALMFGQLGDRKDRGMFVIACRICTTTIYYSFREKVCLTLKGTMCEDPGDVRFRSGNPSTCEYSVCLR